MGTFPPARRRHRAGTAVVGVWCVVAAACGSDGDVDGAAEESSSSTSTSVTSLSSSTAVGNADLETLRERAAFVVDLLDNADSVPITRVEEAFAPAFLADVPASVIVDTTRQATAGTPGPWSIVEFDAAGWSASSVLEAPNGTRLVLTYDLESERPHRIIGAQLLPDIESAQQDPGTLDEIGADLAALAPFVEAVVFDVTAGGCVPEWSIGSGAAFPIASVFKLWVLAAVAESVDRGEVTWDQEVAVEARYRSSPDGEVYPLADGDTVTVAELATAMISISDNTATDHLIGLVGRDAVEAVLAEIGVSSAAQNIPLLTTADLFKLKFVDATLGERYLALPDPESRRRFLDTEVAAVPLPWVSDPAWSTDALDAPIRIMDLEWFATAVDVCQTFEYLVGLDASPGLDAVGDALSVNPGVPGLDGFAEVWFKGGSESGVLVTAHRLHGDDGSVQVVVAALADQTQPIPELAAITVVARLLAAA